VRLYALETTIPPGRWSLLYGAKTMTEMFNNYIKPELDKLTQLLNS